MKESIKSNLDSINTSFYKYGTRLFHELIFISLSSRTILSLYYMPKNFRIYFKSYRVTFFVNYAIYAYKSLTMARSRGTIKIVR